MTKIAEKAKALNGKGVVFSYVCEPQKFYFRELIPGTGDQEVQVPFDRRRGND